MKKLHIGTLPNGCNLEIPYYSFGDNNSSKVYIQSGMHGGEITYWVIKKLYNFLKNNPEKINSNILIVPNANPASWLQRVHYSTDGKFNFYDGKDWNRNFPGKKDGTLGERICDGIMGLCNNSNLIIDLHTSRDSFPFGMFVNENDLIKELGLEYNYQETTEYSKSKYQGAFTDYTSSIGIPSITVECGKHDSYQEDYINRVYKGIINMLLFKGYIVGIEKISFEEQQKLYSKLKNYRAIDGGFIIFNKQVGEKFKKGDSLFEIHNPNNIDEIKTQYAEEDGIIQKISPTHIYWPGDDVITIISNQDVTII